ncbi:MAG: hypothetical protein R3362_03895 [Rhodothermales bacterium]|nr:hypothetical protein [Rhodothermales bacterium]
MGSQTGLLLLVLGVTIAGWLLLALLAAGTADPAPFDVATKWATDLLGLAAALAGFLGIAAAQGATAATEQRVRFIEGGLVGVLAGATLLGVGGWPIPAALAALATGVAAAEVVRAVRE